MSEKIYCSVCGAMLAEDDYHYFDGHIFCEDCLENQTTLCDCCSERIWRNEAEGDEYITICYRCFENHYTTCEDCGRLLHYDDANYDEDNDLFVCRTRYDAPEIDGEVYLPGDSDIRIGDIKKARILESDVYDLYGELEYREEDL